MPSSVLFEEMNGRHRWLMVREDGTKAGGASGWSDSPGEAKADAGAVLLGLARWAVAEMAGPAEGVPTTMLDAAAEAFKDEEPP